MGNNQVRSLDDFPEGFTYLRAVNQAPYKNCRIFQKNSSKALIAVMLLEELPQDTLKFRGVSEHLIDFIDWCKEDINLCGVQSSVSLFYEYCPTTLEAEIMKKKKLNEQFSESQIWYVLNAIVNLESDLSVKSLAHTDLRPCNVLIAQNDTVKFAPAGYFPFEVNSFKKQIFLNEQTYLAPENRDPNLQTVEWQSNDVYAAGLTILDMMTLQLSKNELKSPEAIYHRLQKSKYIYSTPLCDFVERMLKEKPDRITFKQIKQQLIPYQKQINTLQPFEIQPQENPQKLSRSLRHSNDKDLSPQERTSVPTSQMVVQPSQSNLTISPVNTQKQQQLQILLQSVGVSPRLPNEIQQRVPFTKSSPKQLPQSSPKNIQIPHQFTLGSQTIQSPKAYTLPDMKNQQPLNPRPMIPTASIQPQTFTDTVGIPKTMSFAQPQRSFTPTRSLPLQYPQPSITPQPSTTPQYSIYAQQINSQYTFMPQKQSSLPQPQNNSYIMRPIQQTRDASPIPSKNLNASRSNQSTYLTPQMGQDSRKPSTPLSTTPYQRLTPNTQSFTTSPIMRGQSIYSNWATRLPNEDANSTGEDHFLSNTLRKAEQAISQYHSLRHKV